MDTRRPSSRRPSRPFERWLRLLLRFGGLALLAVAATAALALAGYTTPAHCQGGAPGDEALPALSSSHASGAIVRSLRATVGDLAPSVTFRVRRPLIDDAPSRAFPFLDDEDATGSASVGTVTEGYLVNASELVLPGPNYGVLPRQAARGLRYGTDEMVELLRWAADGVEAVHPGSVLWLGNIGRRDGGDIPWSVSHNSGRDADVAYFYVDGDGNQLAPPDLLPVDRQLQAEQDGVVYGWDVERNWTLVKTLLTHPTIQVQFLFIANRLKRELLAYARAAGEPDALIRRAETVMSQPGRSNPHNDHLHVRIYCSPRDLACGCTNLGRVHPWIDTFDGVRAQRIRQVRAYLGAESAEQRARAVERLVAMGAEGQLEAVAALVDDPSPRVRAAAVQAIGAFQGRQLLDRLRARLAVESDARVWASIMAVTGALGSPDDTDLLTGLLAEPRPMVLDGRRLDARVWVVDALAALEADGAVAELVGLSASDDVYLRARVEWALARLTNHREVAHAEDPHLDRLTREAGLAAWQTWLSRYQSLSRADWLRDGFVSAGFGVDVSELDAGVLADAVGSSRAYISYNAQRLLMRRLDGEAPSLLWPRSDARWYWRDRVGP